jgi:hypothetical protein
MSTQTLGPPLLTTPRIHPLMIPPATSNSRFLAERHSAMWARKSLREISSVTL